MLPEQQHNLYSGLEQYKSYFQTDETDLGKALTKLHASLKKEKEMAILICAMAQVMKYVPSDHSETDPLFKLHRFVKKYWDKAVLPRFEKALTEEDFMSLATNENRSVFQFSALQYLLTAGKKDLVCTLTKINVYSPAPRSSFVTTGGVFKPVAKRSDAGQNGPASKP